MDGDPFVGLVGWLVHHTNGGDGSREVLAERSGMRLRTLSDWTAGDYPKRRNTAPVTKLHVWATENVRGYPPPDGTGPSLVSLSGPERTQFPKISPAPLPDRPELAANVTRVESLRGSRHRWPRTPYLVIGIVLAIAATVWLTTRSGSARQQAEDAGGASSPAVPARTAVPAGPTVTEYSGNRANGTPVFASPTGDRIGTLAPASIPYGELVRVRCQVPNQTGASSVTALYLVAEGPWKGLYAVSDTLTNGDPLGKPGGHNVDARVPACP